jgi:putative ABC transport system ATP-binding protein
MVDRGDGNRFAYPDISLEKNDVVLLTGPSGSGKTTLLSVLSGLLPPSTGHVRFAEHDVYQMPLPTRDKLRGQKMGFVFQTLHLLPSLTLRQNVMLAAPMAGCAVDHDRIDMLLGELGLSARAHAYPRELSQGEQQRAAIARAVLNKPSIIFADEPTSALDRENALNVIELLQIQAGLANAALLVASHDDRIMPAFIKVLSVSDVRKAKAA